MPAHNLLELTPLHDQAALLLAQGQTQQAVADHLGLSLYTVRFWMQSNLFQAKVHEYREYIQKEILAYTTQKMQSLQVKAVDRLDYLMDHAQSEAVQLGAVKEVLERGPLRIQRGIDVGKIAPGTVILQEKMLLAMRTVSEMTGDQGMLETLEAFPLVPEEALADSPSPQNGPGGSLTEGESVAND